MYLENEIQMLIDKAHELHEELEKNKKAISRMEFINEQLEETINQLEICVDNLKFLEEENQDDLIIFDGRE